MTVPEAKRQRRENMLDNHEENAAGLQSPAPQPNHTTAPAPEDSVMADSSDAEEPARNGQIVPLDSQEIKTALESCKILVIGAGGLGCEILKNLALTGFKDIHVIDMDTIDVSNLNRQFLFRAVDVGKSKALVASEFVMNRVPGVKITPYFGKIQDKDEEYYSQFQIVICGLDSIEARRWMNAMLVNLVDDESPESLIPMVDGGTEGFKGQARVILPTITSCYECSLDMFNKPNSFPICTIANTPRLPEHCIEWASVLEWPRVFPDQKYDTDNPEHISWLYEVASKRAKEFNILGVTYFLTQGVVKNIIPAIASTNAVIAAACCNEAFKLATSVAPFLNNYMMYTGNDGVYTYTFEHQKKPECPVCGTIAIKIDVDPDMILEDFLDVLKEKPDTQLKKPSLRTATKSLYMQGPPPLEKASRPNLVFKMSELVEDNDEITVTDVALPVSMQLKVRLIKK
ncbi:NEDD8 activating enzyme [Umbelopsis nana]